jgi:DsbC/DsbD-like thiol-disulfide interchange protein
MFTRSWLGFPGRVGHDTRMTIAVRACAGLLASMAAMCLASGASAGGLVGGSLSTAQEPGASLWSAGIHSGVRLLDGGARPEDPDRRLAGLEIRMDPHFKTYWRTPGDSGLPPVFDWSGSTNLRAVEVAWPAPTRFEDQAGSSIGYKSRLVLPLHVTPSNPAEPVVLDLRLDYAVCEKVCIPAHGEARLKLGVGQISTPAAAVIEDFLSQVPAVQAPSETAAPGIRSVAPVGEDRSVVVVAQVPQTTGLVDIFVEGPDGWAFSAPLAVSTLAGPDKSHVVTYRVTVDSRPTGGKLKGLPLRVTMTAGDDAIEVPIALDAGAGPN